jgi:Domain of unknown function (DUF4381)
MTDDIRDIHGPILHHAHVWWPYAVAAIGVLLIVLVARRLMRAHAATPSELALQAIEAARAEPDAERFSTAVSAAVRTYTEQAFGVRAPRRTTDELLADLMSDDSPVARHREQLGEFLQFCDLAKYARWSLSDDQRAGMAESAEAFVRATAGGAA